MTSPAPSPRPRRGVNQTGSGIHRPSKNGRGTVRRAAIAEELDVAGFLGVRAVRGVRVR